MKTITCTCGQDKDFCIDCVQDFLDTVVPVTYHSDKGIPNGVGWYLVRLDSGAIVSDDGKRFDIDQVMIKSLSDGGGYEWSKWYQHNIVECWRLVD